MILSMMTADDRKDDEVHLAYWMLRSPVERYASLHFTREQVKTCYGACDFGGYVYAELLDAKCDVLVACAV